MKEKRNLLIGGGLVGLIAVALVMLGNPKNMGFCIACFIRDIAGGLGLHGAAVVQYIRPEVIGLVCGAFIVAVLKKDFAPRGGSSPLTRFVLGFGVMVGALIFLGCPLRMALRIAGGDLNAVVGLLGFIVGILVGIVFLKKGFTLGRAYKQSKLEGAGITVINVALLVLLVAFPVLLKFSESGPGSMRAPLFAALAAGLVVGAIAQRTRLCMVGGLRDVVLFKDWTLVCGFIAIIVICAIGNIATSNFHLGFMINAETAQPVAHTQHVWNFLGMTVVGLGSVLLGGCPLRQLILAGEGNTDSAVAVLGMFVGAAFCHNFGLASSGAGTTPNGRIACILMLVVMLVIAAVNTKKSKA
jgi:YedE family putative selenium metabolism protein